MNKSVKIFTWSIIGIILLNSSMHFLSHNNFTYIMILLLVVLFTNLIFIILEKSRHEKN